MAGSGCSFTECLQIHTLLFAEEMSVVKWREVWNSREEQQRGTAERNSREQDSTEVPDFAFCSFCPIGILLGSAFPKPCYTQPDGCGNLAQRQSFCKLYRRARLWKSPKLRPVLAASSEKFFRRLCPFCLFSLPTQWGQRAASSMKKIFSPYSTNGRFLSVEK